MKYAVAIVLALALIAVPLAAGAQPPTRVASIGFLETGPFPLTYISESSSGNSCVSLVISKARTSPSRPGPRTGRMSGSPGSRPS
jgi:hypothetical protein